MRYLNIVNKAVTNFFAVWIIVFSVISFNYPWVFDGLSYLIVPALGVVMLGMGLTLGTADFVRILQRPADVSVGISCQLLLMPLLGFIISSLFRADPLVATGVILLGSCPGGTASNVITFLSRGDLALSVTLTLVSTLLAPLFIPVSMYIYAGKWIDVPAAQLFISSVKIVVFPVTAGIILGRLLGAKKTYLTPFLPSISSAGIILIVAVIVAINSQSLISLGAGLILIVIIHNSLGLLLGYWLARVSGMSVNKARAVSIEVGMQNSGLGAVLASMHFGPVTALPSAVFSIWHNISGSLIAFFWSRNGLNDEQQRLQK